MYGKYQSYRALTISGLFRGTRSLCEGTRGTRQEAASSKRVSRRYRAHKEGRSAAVRCYASARTPVYASRVDGLTALKAQFVKLDSSGTGNILATARSLVFPVEALSVLIVPARSRLYSSARVSSALAV